MLRCPTHATPELKALFRNQLVGMNTVVESEEKEDRSAKIVSACFRVGQSTQQLTFLIVVESYHKGVGDFLTYWGRRRRHDHMYVERDLQSKFTRPIVCSVACF